MTRLPLLQLGEDQYVDIKDPKFLPWGVQKKITALLVGDDQDKSASLDVAEMIAVSLVTSGNVVDHEGKPFVFPLDEKSVKEVPSILVERVADEYIRLRRETPDRKN